MNALKFTKKAKFLALTSSPLFACLFLTSIATANARLSNPSAAVKLVTSTKGTMAANAQKKPSEPVNQGPVIVSQYLPYDSYKDAFENNEYVTIDGKYAFLKMDGKIESLEELQADPFADAVLATLPALGNGINNLMIRPAIAKGIQKSDKRNKLVGVQFVSADLAKAHIDEVIKAEQKERTKQWFYGAFSQKHISDNLSRVAMVAGVEFAIDLAGKGAKAGLNKWASTNLAPPYYTRKDTTFHRINFRDTSEGELFLFKAVEAFGRISLDDFAAIKADPSCDYEVGGEVVPEISWQTKARDFVAYGSASILEGMCDALVNASLSEYAATSLFINTNYVVSEGANSEGPINTIVPAKPTFWSSLASSMKTNMKVMGIQSLYQRVKSGVKSLVGNTYQKFFPRFKTSDYLPKKMPYGIANVDGVYRYVYIDSLIQLPADDEQTINNNEQGK